MVHSRNAAMETYRIRYLDGASPIQAIKLVRDFTALGLAEAKHIVDTRGLILDQVSAAEARRVADQFLRIGAHVEVQRTWRTMVAYDPRHVARGDQPLERLRVGELELELEQGELGAWSDGEAETFADPEQVGQRVFAQLVRWQQRDLVAVDDEITLLERVSARDPQLEQHIVANPDEHESRLIYGDWLQAQGDPRGQLIALRCALERATAAAERDELRAQVEAFEAAHAAHLFGPLRTVFRELDPHWRCGILDAAFVGAGLSWSRHSGGPGEVLATLLRLPLAACMTRLGLASSLLDHSHLETLLIDSPIVGNLRELTLGDRVRAPGPRGRASGFARLWPHLTRLRRLTFADQRPPLRTLHSNTLEHLVLRLGSLRQIDRHNGLPDGLEGQFKAGRTPKLRELTLEFVDGEDVEASPFTDLLALPDLQGIRRLELVFTGQVIPHELVETFAVIPKLGSLECFDLSRCMAERRSLEALIAARGRGRLPVELRLPRPV